MGEWKVMRSILVSYELFVTYMTSWVVYKFPKNIKSKNQNRETTKFKQTMKLKNDLNLISI